MYYRHWTQGSVSTQSDCTAPPDPICRNPHWFPLLPRADTEPSVGWRQTVSVLLSLSFYSTSTPIHLQALDFHNSWPLSRWEKEKNAALSLPKSTSLGISSTISHLANLCPALPGGFPWSLLSGLVFLVHQNMLTSRELSWTLLFWKQTIISLIF